MHCGRWRGRGEEKGWGCVSCVAWLIGEEREKREGAAQNRDCSNSLEKRIDPSSEMGGKLECSRVEIQSPLI